MKIEDLEKYGIPGNYIQKLKEENISELYPPQAEVIKKGLFKNNNLILSIPTAGGKTLIATIAMLHKLLEKRQVKTIYIAPLVALAYEKYEYFKRFFDKQFKVAISVGDYDSSDTWLSDYDVICVTTEKLDSLLRHNVKWIEKVELIIIDEIHLLNDSSRGPTLEILLTKLRNIIPQSQIFGLSATISNANELAEWLNAKLVRSDFRPVKLYEGVSFDSKIHFEEKDGYDLSSQEVENAIVENTLNLNKQVLIFTSTRRNAESLAERLCKTTKTKLEKIEQQNLNKLSDEIEHVLDYPTQQCKKLAKCIINGVAFHHAGLLGKQKKSIENNFKNGLIKAIVATPTLAMGVNLPAFRVLVRDAKRYYQGLGSTYIPILEYKQFIGRAGRPAYDTFGESILIAKSENEARDLINHFIYGESESIQSKLSLESVLRMHTLALIASGYCNSEKLINEFFNKTFYSFQHGNMDDISKHLKEIIGQLSTWKFISKNKFNISPTLIGKRISELYLDPLTANEILTGLNNHPQKYLTEFSFLQLVSESDEMRPLASVVSTEKLDITDVILKRYNQILRQIPEEYDLEFEEFLKSIKTALIFDYWINEASEEKLFDKFKITPGELYNKLQILDWLLYSSHELSLLSGYKQILTPIKKLRIRVKYGIKDELIPLIRLKGIGRVRSRKLFNAGLDSLNKLRKIPIENLSKIVGSTVANDIKRQFGKNEAIKNNLQNIDGVAGI